MSSRNAETADGAVRRPAPPVLRLYLLGGFRTERTNGAPVADRRPRPSSRRLVELLAVSPGRVRHREEIIEMCWPDTAGTPAALGSLRVALHAARRALEPELTARTPSSYLVGEGALLRLAPETVWIDADEAETLAERALRTGTTAHLAAALEAFLREHARRSGRLREAAAIGRRALELADGCGDPEAAAFERANLAEVHLLLGEFEAAAELAADAVAEAQAHSGWCLPYALAALARVQLRGGPRPALPDPRELLTRAAHCVSRRPDHQADYEVRTAQAGLALRDVRPDRALALLETVSGTGVPVIAAWAHLTAGDPARAARLAAEEAVRAAGSGEAVTECEARTAQATALAVLGRTDEAGRCAARVRELATALPYPTVLRRVSHANPS
ncbi:hypothetical protein [Streptomyces sp. NBC_00019]|uniref:AfsR/SARP family transcriptional regulator n=1 Tax=Streptomyces sp. NBC_00019 TaxID=2975623 RepID=UPI0032498DBC